MGREDGARSAWDRLAHHGGDIAAARKLYPLAPTPWPDLSTGINPVPYPVGALDPDVFHALPGPDAVAVLEAAAAKSYGCDAEVSVVAAPGTQALIQWLPRLFPASRVGLLGFTYGEHGRTWAASGARIETVDAMDDLADFDVAVVVNPNNPDGRLTSPEALWRVAGRIAARGGTLVVDEAFTDVGAPGGSLVGALPPRTIVLRSFGKTYGLAGLRLGFGVASPVLATPIRDALGPWAVSGAAVAIGCQALGNAAWLAATRARLDGESARMDALLARAGGTLVGGTALFRLFSLPDAPALFDRLARAGILARPFAHRPDWLRFGLPGNEAGWSRLAAALGLA